MTKPDIALEQVFIEELAKKPATFDEFTSRVLHSHKNTGHLESALQNPYYSEPVAAKKRVSQREELYRVPTTWTHASESRQVRYVYQVAIHGAGWGGGDIKGDFAIYVGSDGEFLGWHTSEREWYDAVVARSKP